MHKEELDIDIALFTLKKPEEFYLLINKISELTFEYNGKLIIKPSKKSINKLYRKVSETIKYLGAASPQRETLDCTPILGNR